MYAWAGNQQHPGGFYRVRLTGKPLHLPVRLSAWRDGFSLTFTGKLDRTSATTRQFLLRTWSLKRTAHYGSPHVGEKDVKVARATLSADGKTVHLSVPGLKPTWCMEIGYVLEAANGAPFAGVIHNTVHALGLRQ
jgi:hypothetical protein